ncbi:papain-like cysteine protease family protein [Haliangium sp.]|uniref:papain-like cysteine protease family protein n=1 Tax=Haliangium sp. TaxID=2663208 RepID=UPI003D0B8AD1
MSLDVEVLEPGEAVEWREQGQHFDIWHQVPLVPQLGGMSCWAAAAAMLVGWRDCVAVEGPEVARGAGRWREFSAGLHPRDVHDLARIWGLTVVPGQRHSVASLRRLLERYGPLWMGEAVPGLHVIVLTGMYGDGSEGNTWVRINDPWPVGRGERYRLNVGQLMRNFHRANRIAGLHAQILRTSGRPSGTTVRRRSSWQRTLRIDRSARRTPVSETTGETVALSGEVLTALCRRSQFALPEAARVLFAVRGAQIAAGPDQGFQPRIELVERRPDHRHLRCVVGVWDRERGEVAAFAGSTVPAWPSVQRQRLNPGGHVANLLPPGRYTYDVGTHRGAHRAVPGALVQRGPVVVQRDLTPGLAPSASSWHLVHPVDNVHPAFDGPARAGFVSAGGIAVSGSYHGHHIGPWRAFREAAKLDDGPERPLVLILCTSDDARRAGALDVADDELRFGSSGAQVSALQQRLAGQGLLEPARKGWQLPTPAFVAATRGATDRQSFPPDGDGQLRGHTFMAHARLLSPPAAQARRAR